MLIPRLLKSLDWRILVMGRKTTLWNSRAHWVQNRNREWKRTNRKPWPDFKQRTVYWWMLATPGEMHWTLSFLKLTLQRYGHIINRTSQDLNLCFLTSNLNYIVNFTKLSRCELFYIKVIRCTVFVFRYIRLLWDLVITGMW